MSSGPSMAASNDHNDRFAQFRRRAAGETAVQLDHCCALRWLAVQSAAEMGGISEEDWRWQSWAGCGALLPPEGHICDVKIWGILFSIPDVIWKRCFQRAVELKRVKNCEHLHLHTFHFDIDHVKRQDWEEPKPASPEPKGPKGSKGSTGSKEKPEPADITQFGLPDDQFELSTKLDAGGQGTVFRSEAEAD